MDRDGEGTKFTIDRKIFSSDLWFSSPWKLKIFIYLLGNANHADGNFMGIEIKRGQLIRSIRTIRKENGYKIGYRMKYPSFDTIRRCCEKLTKEERIVQRTVQCGTLFTICNYNELQQFEKVRTVQGKRVEPFSDRSETVHNKNDKNVKNDKNKDMCSEIYDFYLELLNPKYKTRSPAEKWINKLLKVHPSEDLKKSIENYKAELNGSEYVKDPRNFFGRDKIYHDFLPGKYTPKKPDKGIGFNEWRPKPRL